MWWSVCGIRFSNTFLFWCHSYPCYFQKNNLGLPNNGQRLANDGKAVDWNRVGNRVSPIHTPEIQTTLHSVAIKASKYDAQLASRLISICACQNSCPNLVNNRIFRDENFMHISKVCLALRSSIFLWKRIRFVSYPCGCNTWRIWASDLRQLAIVFEWWSHGVRHEHVRQRVPGRDCPTLPGISSLHQL